MNAPFAKPASPDVYADRLNQAHNWRSNCIQSFADLEVTIGNALQLLAKTKKVGTSVKLGQQFKAAAVELKRLTAPKGAFAKVGKPLQSSLVALEPRLEWRAHLTHGLIDAWGGRNGRWLITLHHRESDNAGPLRWHAMPWDEAIKWQECLATDVQKLNQKFDALKTQLTGAV